MEERNHDKGLRNRDARHKQLDAAGWGLFFIWIGISLFARVGWGTGLLGVGIIILGAQATRNCLGLKLERFRVAFGFLFVLGGVWQLFHVPLDFMPILCIAAGVSLLLSALFGKAKDQTGGQNHSSP